MASAAFVRGKGITGWPSPSPKTKAVPQHRLRAPYQRDHPLFRIPEGHIPFPVHPQNINA